MRTLMEMSAKKLLAAAAVVVIATASFTASAQVSEGTSDDLYINKTPSTYQPAVQSSDNSRSNDQSNYDYNNQQQGSQEYSSTEKQTDENGGTTYITNNYYNSDGDGWYTSQLNHFYSPYVGFNYFSPFYYGMGMYDPFFVSPGFSLSVGFGFGFGNSGFYPYYNPWYNPWAYSWYNPWYSPWYTPGFYSPYAWGYPYYGGYGGYGGYYGDGYGGSYSNNNSYYGYHGSASGNTSNATGGRIYKTTDEGGHGSSTPGTSSDSYYNRSAVTGGSYQNVTRGQDDNGGNGSVKLPASGLENNSLKNKDNAQRNQGNGGQNIYSPQRNTQGSWNASPKMNGNGRPHQLTFSQTIEEGNRFGLTNGKQSQSNWFSINENNRVGQQDFKLNDSQYSGSKKDQKKHLTIQGNAGQSRNQQQWWNSNSQRNYQSQDYRIQNYDNGGRSNAGWGGSQGTRNFSQGSRHNPR